MTDTYNGWANHSTWNVILWMSNDEFLYNTAKACVEFRQGDDSVYGCFKRCMSNIERHTTGDGVRWDDTSIDVEEVEALMFDLAA